MFNILGVDFKKDTSITQKTQMKNPYTFIMEDDGDKFLAVYDTEVSYNGDKCHVVRITFGPSEIWKAVKQNLFENSGILPGVIEDRVVNYSGNLEVVTLEFYDDESLDGEHLAPAEKQMIREVADAVMDALYDLN